MDVVSRKRRSEIMANIRSKGMKPEMIVRRLVHAMGYRYRLHRRDLPGTPDLVFPKKKKIIFVHGCFWHQHNDENCKISRLPKSNTSYWIPKLKKNVDRDRKNVQELKDMGWDVLIIWECETKNIDYLKKKIFRFLDD